MIVWSVSKAPGGLAHKRGIIDSPSTHDKLADAQKALAHNVWSSHIILAHAITGFDTIPAPHNLGKQNNIFVSEDEEEIEREGGGGRCLDYNKSIPTEGCQSQ